MWLTFCVIVYLATHIYFVIISMNTPKRGPNVPLGTVVVNDKWHGTPLGSEIHKQKIGFFMDAKDFGVVDFFVSPLSPVVYISQADMALGVTHYKAKLSKVMAQYPVSSITLITDRNEDTVDAYDELVDLATIELDLNIIPVGNQMEIPLLLSQMVSAHINPVSNPFKQKRKPNLAEIQLKMMGNIPLVGSKKIQILFEKFGNIEGMAEASVEELIPHVGEATAKSVWGFFNENIRLGLGPT